MLHSKRVWGPPREVESAEELARLLTEHSWVLCSAFSHGGYLYLNDAISEDSAAEFAVFKPVGEGFIQVESITFSWCRFEQALAYIRGIAAGRYDPLNAPPTVSPRIDSSRDHVCELCR